VSMFVSYLISIAFFGLFQAVFMANAGGSWDNAKKVIEVDMKEKGTDLHAASVVGDTVGDPFKDTSGPSMNILIKLMSIVSLVIAPHIATKPHVVSDAEMLKEQEKTAKKELRVENTKSAEMVNLK